MSTAVLDRCMKSRSTPPAIRPLPARAVEQVATPSDLGHFFGQQMVQVHAALCAPEIEAGDCIEVDFDRREVRYDGLYMIAIKHDDGGIWYGARRFAFRPSAGGGTELWGFDICTEHWASISAAVQSRITVYGEIREVFKPASKLRRAAV